MIPTKTTIMEQQMVNIVNGDVIVFEQFGDVMQVVKDDGKKTVQQRFAAMNMVMLMVCYSGWLHLKLNGHYYEVTSGWSIACLPSTSIEDLEMSADVHLRGFGFSVTAMESMFHTYRHTWQEALSLNDHPLVRLNAQHMQVAEHFYQIVKIERQMTDNIHYHPMVRSLAQAMLYMMADVISKAPAERDLVVPQREQQFKRFVQLLWANGGKVRNVAYFADQMCITPKYLSVIVREACGKTPIQMIHDYSANMIAQRLRTTNMSIKEIANELNFCNESFFGRYVKKHLGYPPKEFASAPRGLCDGCRGPAAAKPVA